MSTVQSSLATVPQLRGVQHPEFPDGSTITSWPTVRRLPIRMPPRIASGVRIPPEGAKAGTTIETAEPPIRLTWVSRDISSLVSFQHGRLTCYDGVPMPNAEALRNAIAAVVALSEIDFEPASIDPSADEGVCLAFRAGDKYADIECFNSGEILATTVEGLQEPRIWQVKKESLRSAVSEIHRFISG